MTSGVRRTGKHLLLYQEELCQIMRACQSRLRHHQISSKGDAYLRKAISRLRGWDCHCHRFHAQSRLCSHRGNPVVGIRGAYLQLCESDPVCLSLDQCLMETVALSMPTQALLSDSPCLGADSCALLQALNPHVL